MQSSHCLFSSSLNFFAEPKGRRTPSMSRKITSTGIMGVLQHMLLIRVIPIRRLGDDQRSGVDSAADDVMLPTISVSLRAEGGGGE